MPYVNIKVTDESVNAEQKRQLIEGATHLLVTVLNKEPATTHVVIDLVPTDNWGVSGQPVTRLRQQQFKEAIQAQAERRAQEQ